MENAFPNRKRLPHQIPSWVPDGEIFFITLNARHRDAAPLLELNRPSLLWESAQTYADRHLWWPHLLLVMPDHLHMLASFAPLPGMVSVVPQWKRWTARTLQIHWQRGFFDHRIRNAAEYDEKAFYIRHNPVRKQLVPKPQDWPHVWEAPRA